MVHYRDNPPVQLCSMARFSCNIPEMARVATLCVIGDVAVRCTSGNMRPHADLKYMRGIAAKNNGLLLMVIQKHLLLMTIYTHHSRCPVKMCCEQSFLSLINIRL